MKELTIPQFNILTITIIILILTMISATVVSSVSAEVKGGPNYLCTHIENSGTIGKTKCCTQTGLLFCTICDDTTPPSNCEPRTRSSEDSGDKGIDPSTSGTYTEDNSNSGNQKGIDPNNSGGIFNQ